MIILLKNDFCTQKQLIFVLKMVVKVASTSTKTSTEKVMLSATVTVVCYKWKTLSNGENPLMLRVTKEGKSQYQSLGISVNPKHWNFKTNEPKPKCPNYEQIQKIIIDKKAELQKKMLDMRAEQKEITTSALLINDKDRDVKVGEFCR